MGTLVAKRYPTGMVLGLADHTYVECGTGNKGWGCWGGKKGGTPLLRSGETSTARADEIAGDDGYAGITCYLVNGVCHQAANRILFPVGELVRGARGYWVSSLIFGTYGRPRGALDRCRAPFERHEGITGDLPECVEGAKTMGKSASKFSEAEDAYLRGILALYERAELATLIETDQASAFMTQHLLFSAKYRLGADYTKGVERTLTQEHESFETGRLDLEKVLESKELPGREFAKRFDALTRAYQDNLADSLPGESYRALFALDPDDRITLADPEIVEREFGG